MINANISDETGGEIMTIAEQLRHEGELKGKLETVQEMLNAGTDVAFIAKVTRLPIEKIKALKKH